MEQSTIRAFQSVLRNFRFKQEPESFSEDFAIKRYHKKMEEPMAEKQKQLAEDCWSQWITFDGTLPINLILPNSIWYKVRARIHKDFRNAKTRYFASPNFRFPKGSQFEPNRGHTSIEAVLCQRNWTCTPENFEAFASLAYRVHGLRKAAKQRYKQWFERHDFDLSMSEADALLYRRFSKTKHSVGFSVFKWKLERTVRFERGARFSTVPKNNEKRRPINIECFANVLTQSEIGEGLRSLLLNEYMINLDSLADIHRLKIQDVDRWATIDLQNASDSVSKALVRFLFPEWFVVELESRAAPFVLGPDSLYYETKKISAMGNGFTFELMTYILVCLCVEYDPLGTSFGDDITVDPKVAPDLIKALESVGFVVNQQKSFISGDFRESCGANYHRLEGYIESFDFLWPETIADCVNLLNKAYFLGRKYRSFKDLYNALLRTLPAALHGGPFNGVEEGILLKFPSKGEFQIPTKRTIPNYFITPMKQVRISARRPTPALEAKLQALGYSDFFLVPGWEFKGSLRTPTMSHLPSSKWAKYLFYLNAGRKAKDVIRDSGEWSVVWLVTDGRRTMRASALNLSN